MAVCFNPSSPNPKARPYPTCFGIHRSPVFYQHPHYPEVSTTTREHEWRAAILSPIVLDRPPSALQATLPVARPTLEVHDRNNPNAVGLRDIHHGVGEAVREDAPHGRIESPVAAGMQADIVHQFRDFVVKASAQRRSNFSIVTDRLQKLRVRLGMKGAVHRPISLRALAKVSSSGMP